MKKKLALLVFLAVMFFVGTVMTADNKVITAQEVATHNS